MNLTHAQRCSLERESVGCDGLARLLLCAEHAGEPVMSCTAVRICSLSGGALAETLPL